MSHIILLFPKAVSPISDVDGGFFYIILFFDERGENTIAYGTGLKVPIKLTFVNNKFVEKII